jgi:hypothetical protein
MWLIPLIVIGLVVYAASNHRDSQPLELAPPQQYVPPPGPIAVLGELLRVGHEPPPPVIMCAIAEAESLGRNDLASDIVRTFVAPVVYRHELERMRAAKPMPTFTPAPASAPARARAYEPPRTQTPAPVSAPSPARGERSASCFPTRSTATQTEAPLPPFPATDDEIRAMLNVDPERFLEMARRGPIVSNRAPAVVPATVPAVQPMVPSETVAKMEEAELPAVAEIARGNAPSSSSPIEGVTPADWSTFCERIAREKPEYKSSRHVGQYRQRVDRLIELGIDPVTVIGSATAQRAALDVDMADACYHAHESGLIDNHLRRLIRMPGRDEPQMVSLSGVLGVIQAAGLEGAVGWLENKDDRYQYPHTTQAFLKTNGVF